MLLAVSKQLKTQDILDYGSGKGSIAMALPFSIKEYDPAVEGKEATPEPADIVYCGDVLEHIEPECLEAVLDDLKRVTKVLGVFSVCCIPALKVLEDGRNAHLIVKSPYWWADKVYEKFQIKGLKVLGDHNSVQIVVTPKV